MEWVIANKDWLFSGIGIVVLGLIAKFFFGKKNGQTVPAVEVGRSNSSSTNYININTGSSNSIADSQSQSDKSLDAYKNVTRILFIDDDARFKVAKILNKSGWVHTKLIKDCETLDDKDVVDAQILFIDVQGVGVSLGFADEGLGLALAIKEKYPMKKIIIYSAETNGDRFHEALRKADSFLAKNADPYEFQKIVEEFTVGG
jgi:hypothetical protein